MNFWRRGVGWECMFFMTRSLELQALPYALNRPPRAAASFNKRGAGKGGFAGLWRAGRAWPALPDRERWETARALGPDRRAFDVDRKINSCYSRGEIRKGYVVRFRLHELAPVLLLLSLINAWASVLYVDVNSASPTPPYTNWATAATNIQDAVDAASAGDKIWVNDGLYQTGGCALLGSMTNRVAVTKAVEVQSVNGPSVTVIRGAQIPYYLTGDGAIRCAY